MKKMFVYILILALLVLIAGCATPLMKAAKTGDVKAVNALLEQGADIDERNEGGTALIWAAHYGSTSIVKLLLDKGADVNATDYYCGWTALYSAVWGGHADIVQILLARGADVSIVSTAPRANSRTPLQLAEAKGNTLIARMLKVAEEEKYKGYVKTEKPPAYASREPSAAVKSDVDELPVMQVKLNKNAYAIVIGVEKYRQKLPKADFADNDAKIMAEYLTKVMGYPEENIVTLINDHAAKSDFEKYLGKWLPNNVEKNSSVFIYYSGHGAPNPKTGDAFLVPYDGDPSFIEETGYPLKRLYAKLDKLPAREIIVVLDSCFSGAGGRSVLAKGARPLVMNMEKQVFHSDRIAILSASSGSQISSTHDKEGHGLFTYFLLKGLKGDADTNNDGTINIGELYGYISPNVERIARKVYNNEQTPQIIVQNNQLSRQILFIK
ncbi:MAG: ankyrin repeat domain-containing protein [Proteobacteria bacterium]|nr:peptidase C14 [Desulfobacteraceae bacterium]MBU4011902.1 ankyrin repeat domain-containing protein [Pseudomonadota bacterium]MBU4066763.1 ankyrin repeat domain-containing protein [Pseudomonadota bacterium]MBU4102176.1 ankyrin repeat domain-containing protein [Pseudomonadota bacterium]